MNHPVHDPDYSLLELRKAIQTLRATNLSAHLQSFPPEVIEQFFSMLGQLEELTRQAAVGP